ncbi:MAG: ParB/RepB/Spo0J family partition protein [Lawsonibacter sp.]|nr:ParB/RepB/Spo0J family partition protein [Lawsonibacter sp.]
MWPQRKKGLFESGRVLFLPLDAIQPNPDQPRRSFDQPALEELAESIRALGVLQPLTVRRREGAWELVAGERRLRAARLAGLETIPCLSIQTDGQTSSLLALVENLQRRDLDFWEEALALRQLVDTYRISQEEVARRVGKSQSAVANKLRLLKLAPETLALLRDGGAGERHARALLRLEDPAQQLEAARQVVERGLTVAQTEGLVEALLTAQPAPVPRRKPTYLFKDVRLFLNTVTRSIDIMRSAGVDAQCRRQDTEDEILLTIHIPRREGKGVRT